MITIAFARLKFVRRGVLIVARSSAVTVPSLLFAMNFLLVISRKPDKLRKTRALLKSDEKASSIGV